jgi:hypothetical protein
MVISVHLFFSMRATTRALHAFRASEQKKTRGALAPARFVRSDEDDYGVSGGALSERLKMTNSTRLFSDQQLSLCATHGLPFLSLAGFVSP